MTEPDIIRIDGVEYELINPEDHLRALMCLIRPKREQTGWACRECPFQCRSAMNGLDPPTTFRCSNRRVVPVYASGWGAR